MPFTFERGGDIYQSAPHATDSEGKYYQMDFETATEIMDTAVNFCCQIENQIDQYTKSEIQAAWELIYNDLVEDY
jgi:hypothetical protein